MTAKHPRIGLVGCVKSKRPDAAAAKELYTSPLFRGRRAWVERTCDRWFVLSAENGVVEPNTWLEPYDKSLVMVGRRERRAWSARVLADLQRRLKSLRGVTFEIHAGAAYRDYGLTVGLERSGATVVAPARGLGQGHQLALYKVGPPSQMQRRSAIANNTDPSTAERNLPRNRVRRGSARLRRSK